MNIVIGGASGIGAATVPLLAGDTLVADLKGAAEFCDLTDRASIEALAAKVDRLDALVITAGVSPVQADAATVLDVDLAGVGAEGVQLEAVRSHGSTAHATAAKASVRTAVWAASAAVPC